MPEGERIAAFCQADDARYRRRVRHEVRSCGQHQGHRVRGRVAPNLAMVGQIGESGRVQQCACIEYKLDWFRFIPAGRVGLRDRRRYCYEQAREQSQLRDRQKNDGQISRH